MPDVVRVGVLVRPRARWLVEADVVYERWSTLRSIALLPRGIVIASDNLGTSKPLPDIVFQKNFDDAFSVRLGGEHELVPGRLTVRAGYLHETSAVPIGEHERRLPELGARRRRRGRVARASRARPSRSTSRTRTTSCRRAR